MHKPSDLPALAEAYRQTTYYTETPRGCLQLRVGHCHPELDALLSAPSDTWAFITACNPGSIQLSIAENQRRQSILREELEHADYLFYPGYSQGDDYSWPPEESFLIIGVSEVNALALAARHRQLAILFAYRGERAQLVWT